MLKDAKAVAQRTAEFFESPKPDALIQIRHIDELASEPMPPLNSFSFPKDMVRYLDMRAEREKSYWEKRAGLSDDTFASISPWYGIAEHTAFLGGAVDFSESTSYNHTICPEWADTEKLKLDENNEWLRLVIDGISHYREKWGGDFVPKMRGADGPSDIANIVRGNELFYDVYDEPEKVTKLVDFCADAAKFTLELQKKAAGETYGGYLTGFDIWMPGNCIGQISEDASCMMSPDIYTELFLGGLKRLVAGYDHVMLHTHSLGKDKLPIFAQIPNIDVIELSSDPNADRAIEVWRQYREVLADKIVITAPTLEELKANADLLAGRKSIIWFYAKTLDEARQAVEFVRGAAK